MKPAELLRMRLRSQLVDRSDATSPHAVVARLMAMQAQDYPGALWAIGARLPGSVLGDIETALAERTIVRTWPMRGTLHFVTADDVRWLLPLLTPRIIERAATRERGLELDERVFATAREALTGALTGGRTLARADAMATLEAAGVATDGQRGYHVLWRLAQEGTLVLGAMEGKQQTFALLDEWVPQERSRFSADTPREELLAHLAERFFVGHGPATVADLARWAGITKREAASALTVVASALESAEVDGERYWFSPAVAGAAATRSGVHLLPSFDEYLIGYSSRTVQLGRHHGEYGTRIGTNGMVLPVIVSDARVIGMWKRTYSGKRVRFELIEFEPFSASVRKGIAAQGRRYARFVGRELAE